MNSKVYMAATTSFIGILTRRLVDKGVFSQEEMEDLLDAWFQEVVLLGAEVEPLITDGDPVQDVLQMIHSLTKEFTPK